MSHCCDTGHFFAYFIQRFTNNLFMEFRTIKGRLFFYSLSFVAIVVVVVMTAFLFLRRHNQLNMMVEDASQVQNITQLAVDQVHQFLLYETANPEFFATGESEFLTRYRILLDKLPEITQRLAKNKFSAELEIEGRVIRIVEDLNAYDSLFKQTIEKVTEKGFKDKGLEGRMRDFVHQLENNSSLSLAQVLTLRRHEKDYMIRHDAAYVSLLNQEVLRLLQTVRSPTDKSLLAQYQQTFQQIVDLDNVIGLKINAGLTGEMRAKSSDIQFIAEGIRQKVEDGKAAAVSNMTVIFIGIITVAVLLTLWLSNRIAAKITYPIRELSLMIDMVVLRDFDLRTPLLKPIYNDEVGRLTTNFNIMIERIRTNLKSLNERKHAEE